MVFSANPLSLSVPEPAFESWLRDSGYLEILDEQTTNLDHHHHHTSSSSSTSLSNRTTTSSTTTTTTAPSSTTTNHGYGHGYILFNFSILGTIYSFFRFNPFAKLTSEDFSGETPSWTLGFIGSVDSYSFPASPSQAKLRVQENIKRYARNYCTLFILFFACTLYQMPISLVGLISLLALWDLLRLGSEKWGLERYPSVRLSLVRLAQCSTAVILYLSSVQIAVFCALVISYSVMILHASLRKLSPSKQLNRADGNRRFQQSKSRS